LGEKINAIAENNMQRIQDLQMLLLAIVLYLLVFVAIFLMGKYCPGNFAHWKHSWGLQKYAPEYKWQRRGFHIKYTYFNL
jgi:hypothetical protein